MSLEDIDLALGERLLHVFLKLRRELSDEGIAIGISGTKISSLYESSEEFERSQMLQRLWSDLYPKANEIFGKNSRMKILGLWITGRFPIFCKAKALKSIWKYLRYGYLGQRLQFPSRAKHFLVQDVEDVLLDQIENPGSSRY